jgi:hypothetical protein
MQSPATFHPAWLPALDRPPPSHTQLWPLVELALDIPPGLMVADPHPGSYACRAYRRCLDSLDYVSCRKE